MGVFLRQASRPVVERDAKESGPVEKDTNKAPPGLAVEEKVPKKTDRRREGKDGCSGCWCRCCVVCVCVCA